MLIDASLRYFLYGVFGPVSFVMVCKVMFYAACAKHAGADRRVVRGRPRAGEDIKKQTYKEVH